MSAVSEAAELNVYLADFAAQDTSGKLNIIGAGITMIGIDPRQGTTARFTVVGRVGVPQSLCPVEATIEVALLEEDGSVVSFSDTPSEASRSLRVGSVYKFDRPNVPGGPIVPTSILSYRNVIIDLNGGAPLRAGGLYRSPPAVAGARRRGCCVRSVPRGRRCSAPGHPELRSHSGRRNRDRPHVVAAHNDGERLQQLFRVASGAVEWLEVADLAAERFPEIAEMLRIYGAGRADAADAHWARAMTDRS